MAQKKKRKTTASRSAGRKPASGRNTAKRTAQPRQKEYIDYSLYLEIALWVVIALDILLFLGMIGLGGMVGRAVSNVFFGLFGLLAYIVPFFIIFITAFLISNYHSRIAKIKAAGAAGMYLTLCGVLQMLLVGYNNSYSLDEYYQAGAAYHTGGGFFGGCLVSFFCPAIGVAGTYVVFLLMALICCILITQRSLFDGVKRGGSGALARARAGKERRRQETARKRKEREENAQTGAQRDGEDPDTLAAEDGFFILPKNKPVRLHRKVSGVTTDTDLLPIRPVKENSSVKEAGQKISGQKPETENTKDTLQQVPDLPWDDILPENPIQKETAANDTASGEDLMNLFKRTAEKEQNAAFDKARRKKTHPKASEVKSEDASQAAAPQERQAEQTAEEKITRKPKASAAEIQAGIDDVAKEIAMMQAPVKPVYVFPPINLLKKSSGSSGNMTQSELKETAAKLQQVFQTFGVKVKVTNVTCGPSVTRYELTPELGVKVSKIVNLQDDIKLNLAVTDIRIEAPIPGKAAVGIEVPNKKSTGVLLREILESDEFRSHKSKLTYAVGKDIGGNIIVSDIARMPHLLIAGATGSGKSVFINTLIMSILYKADPEEVKLIMIDPKVVELSVYNGIPHLFIPVVTDPKKAAGALNWAVVEMQNRYNMFAEAHVRDLKGYNARIDQLGDIPDKPARLPQIVVIVDELADLMMVSSTEVEEAICRLAQLARAAGIHLVIATQRPSVDVITGLIKANMPSRIAFAVSSGVDSRTILDSVGAEKLLGNGDMLFDPTTFKQPLRVQGAYVSDEEVARVVEYIKENSTPSQTEEEMKKRLNEVESAAASTGNGVSASESDTDELFAQAGKLIIDKDKASIGMLQRWFKIGFNRAARIMDQLADAGVVGPEEGTKPRKVLMSEEQFENYLEQN